MLIKVTGGRYLHGLNVHQQKHQPDGKKYRKIDIPMDEPTDT